MKDKLTESSLEPVIRNDVSSQTLSWQRVLLKATGLALVFTLILLVITAVVVGVFAYFRVSEFLIASNLTFTEAKAIVQEGIKRNPPVMNGKTTILVLGLDTVANKSDAPPLTDTILLLSIDYQTGTINLLSLPRDLWSDAYKTKINALYYYGQERYPDQPEKFPTEVVSEMTGIPIHYTVVFSLDSIAEIVDILGGLEVTVPTSFTDHEFPREDVDLAAATSSAELYETITFTEGTEVMTADRVKKYIRSRHSVGDTGTDIDRAARQQLVITSLTKATLSRKVVTNPQLLSQLYIWYTERLAPFIPVTEAVSIANALVPVRNSIVFTPNSLSIKTEETEGVIEHLPPAQTDNQWTYTLVDEQAFKYQVRETLF